MDLEFGLGSALGPLQFLENNDDLVPIFQKDWTGKYSKQKTDENFIRFFYVELRAVLELLILKRFLR